MSEPSPANPLRKAGRAPVWVAVGVIAAALVVGAAVAFAMTRSDDSPSVSAEGDAPAEPERLVLEAAGSPGSDPFTPTVAVDEASIEPAAELASPSSGVTSDQPGLYGGTRDESACDAAALVDFLEQNPEQAAAWADALDITPEGIRAYVAQLTPVVLRVDTRVTNHGYVDGRATPFQSVLQAGTAVMVDTTGVPRVRCSCGNPLTEPAPFPALTAALRDDTVTLVGEPWRGWDPALVVIRRAGGTLSQFVLWDLVNGGEYIVLIGGTPPPTAPPPTVAPPTTVPPTTAPPPVDPSADDDCRNDPPSGDPTDGFGSGDVGCNPATGEYVCYLGADIVPCPQDG